MFFFAISKCFKNGVRFRRFLANNYNHIFIYVKMSKQNHNNNASGE